MVSPRLSLFFRRIPCHHTLWWTSRYFPCHRCSMTLQRNEFELCNSSDPFCTNHWSLVPGNLGTDPGCCNSGCCNSGYTELTLLRSIQREQEQLNDSFFKIYVRFFFVFQQSDFREATDQNRKTFSFTTSWFESGAKEEKNHESQQQTSTNNLYQNALQRAVVVSPATLVFCNLRIDGKLSRIMIERKEILFSVFVLFLSMFEY